MLKLKFHLKETFSCIIKISKAQIRKQLKTKYPNWKRLSKKEKRVIAKMVLDEVVKDYDFSQEVKTPLSELLGIDEQLRRLALWIWKKWSDSSSHMKTAFYSNLMVKDVIPCISTIKS